MEYFNKFLFFTFFVLSLSVSDSEAMLRAYVPSKEDREVDELASAFRSIAIESRHKPPVGRDSTPIADHLETLENYRETGIIKVSQEMLDRAAFDSKLLETVSEASKGTPQSSSQTRRRQRRSEREMKRPVEEKFNLRKALKKLQVDAKFRRPRSRPIASELSAQAPY